MTVSSAPTTTLCPYCGVGCGLEVLSSTPGEAIDSEKISYKVRGDRAHSSSKGQVCVKGATVAEALDKDRLQYPHWRSSLEEPFQRITWEEAFEIIANRLRTVRGTWGSRGMAVYGSGQLQTEDYYVIQKFLKGCLGTNNFDSNSRLCMSSAVSGYFYSLGSDGPPCCYEDLDLTDCAFLVGTNTAECHPIVFNRFRKNHKANPRTKLIVVDPRQTETAAVADFHLAIRPGTDIDLFNGLAHLLLQWDRIDRSFIDQYTDGFDAMQDLLAHYPPERVSQTCGISTTLLEAVAHCWAESDRVLSLWSMGINQSSEGTAKVRTLINLHLLTGQICKPGAGPFSLTGQPNAMGGRESGGLAHILPGYRQVKNPAHRQELEAFWQLPPGHIAPQPGLNAKEIITALEMGTLPLLWIVATNPAVSLPDLKRSQAALRRSPFTIYQDAYFPTETAAYAHLLLPAAQWGEKTGTMTNSERVVTLCPAFRSPPGEAKADWEIFAEVARRSGFADQFAFQTSAAVYQEFVQITRGRVCDMSGLSHDRLRREGAIQWPCPAESPDPKKFEHPSDSPDFPKAKEHQDPITHPNTKRLYGDRHFPSPNGRAQFAAYHSRGLAEPPDPDYPFVLTNGRLYGHWHTQTRTGRIEKTRKMYPQPFVEMHPKDAERLGIQDNQWVTLRSRRGSAQFPVRITTAISPQVLFVPMHWGALWAEDSEANALTHPEACPISGQPELKACAVRVDLD
jgi:ferredoxin-nitrate reductase